MGRAHFTKALGGTTAISPDQFGKHHETPLEDFGMKPVPIKEQGIPTNEGMVAHVEKVPTEKLRAGQYVVNTERVQHFIDNPPKGGQQVAQGLKLPSGEVMLTDGHHRAAADIVRGKKTHHVEIIGSLH
jgi:hypothetical protein